jgi:secondary thiamine-phosphate synthase enzyme
MASTFTVSTTQHKQCVEITESVREIVREAKVESGLCHVMALHATAAIVINENDDPCIGTDLIAALDRMIPDHAGWQHDRVDNNAQAHIKAAILGPSETIAIENSDLVLGTWQGIILVELDGPRTRRTVSVRIVANES